MGAYLVEIIKIGTITFVIQKAIKVSGKIDFAEVITLAGVALIGVQVIGLVSYEIANPPKIISMLGSIGNGINNLCDSNGILNKILTFGMKN